MQKVTVQVGKAILTRRTQLVAQKSPYVEISIQGNKNRTRVLSKAGDMPEWNESFEYILSTGDWALSLQVEVKDQNNINDSLVGQVIVQINPLNPAPLKELKWHSLKYTVIKDGKKSFKPAGKIMLAIDSSPQHLGYSHQSTMQIPQNFHSKFSLKQITQNPNTAFQYTSPIKSSSHLQNNQDSNIIRLNSTVRSSRQKQKQKSQINFVKPLDFDKPFNLVNTNETFYTGKRGVKYGGYSVEKPQFSTGIQSLKRGTLVKGVPFHMKGYLLLNAGTCTSRQATSSELSRMKEFEYFMVKANFY